MSSALGRGAPFDVIVWFVTSQRELAKGFVHAAGRLEPSGGFWVAWPKKSSGVASDMTEDAVRAVALGPRAWSTTRFAPSTRPGRACAA
jgi:hypothetical protein